MNQLCVLDLSYQLETVYRILCNIIIFHKLFQAIACESVDEESGECATGAAFATCAGFLAFALKKAISLQTSTMDIR